MERRAQFLLVAIFLLVSIGGLIAFMRWISPESEVSLDRRLVQFEGSVSGLSVGSEVRYLGVPVGRVLGIGLSAERVGRVDVWLGLDETLPASDQLVGLLEPQGITGLSLVELRDRETDAATIDVSAGVMPGQPSILSEVSDAALQIVQQTNETLTQVRAILSEQMLDNLEATAGEVRILTGNLARAFSGVHCVAGHAGTGLENVGPGQSDVHGDGTDRQRGLQNVCHTTANTGRDACIGYRGLPLGDLV